MDISSCAFTGHRPQKFPWRYDEGDSRCVALKDAIAGQIALLAEAGVTDWFSGMADGTDCWAAAAVLALREKHPEHRLHCLLPCEGQESEWSLPAQERYRSILERADSVTYVSRAYTRSCMLERNRRLVDSAGRLLAVYNGVWRSGTGATVRYARKQGREIIVLHPLTLEISTI